MPTESRPATILRFAAFELDLRTGELRKKGVRVKLQGQPIQVLTLLLQRAGEVVSREDLRAAIWPSDTFVDFDNSLNTAVNKLREALGDSAEDSRFIETLPRRGYRFLVPVASQCEAAATTNGVPSRTLGRLQPRRTVLLGGVAAILLVGLIAAGAFYLGTRVPIRSIAVMPFANVSGDPNSEYLSDGITEGVIDELSRLPNIKVISRTSAFRYKKAAIEPKKVARELGVEALITGRVIQRGDKLSIDAELVDAREDSHLWGQDYNRTIDDTASIQQEIAQAVSEHLQVRLTSEQRRSLAKSRATNPEAYQLYLKGRYHANLATANEFQKSIDYFRQAIDKDPGFALAYAGLADSYLDRAGGWLYLSPSESFPSAKAAAMKALELDPTLAEAHAALAYAMHYDWDWAGAEREFRRAIELNPNSADSRERYAEYLVTRGRFNESLVEARQAEVLDPLSLETVSEAGTVLLMARRYDESIAQYQKALDLYPNSSVIRALLGYAYALKRSYPQAIAEFAKIPGQDKATTAQNQFVASLLGSVYALSGRRADALKIAQELTRLSSHAYISFYGPGAIYAALGDKDQAFRCLEKAYEQKFSELLYLAVDPILDGIRSDPRYTDLLRRIRLPQPG